MTSSRLMSARSLDEEVPRLAKRARLERSQDDETQLNLAENKELEDRSLNSQGSSASTRRKRGKAKATADPTPSDYPRRATSLWKVGAHISAAGGVENSVHNAASIGANAFALFLKSQRKWASPPLTDTSVQAFKSRMKEFGYGPRDVLPHGSYLINLGNPDDEKREKAYGCFLDDLKRCERLGLELYNFHPGSTVGGTTKDTSISLIADCINRAHKETTAVVTVLENMAGSGNTIGSSFADLTGIIGLVHDKSRVGVCLDTCHMFAAGYDIRTKDVWESTLLDFDAQIGLRYLLAMHLNDSKAPLGSKRDLHQNIGLGHLGLPVFHHIVTDSRTQSLPLILETPSFEKTEVWAKEVEVLNRLSGVDGELGNNETLGWGQEIREVVEKASGGSGGQGSKPKRTRTV